MLPSPHAAADRPPAVVRPLTRRNAADEPYKRTPEVEAQIAASLSLDHPAFLAAARRRYDEPGHLKDETLCYFFRERLRADRRDEANDLAGVLAARHAGTVARHASKLDSLREDCASEMFARLFEPLLDLEGDAGDFAQVRFGLFLKRIATDVVARALTARRQREAAIAPRGDECDPLDRLVCSPALPIEESMDVRRGLARLPEELRTIFVLRHYFGWQIEAEADDQSSISRRLGVTPRTVRNRLKRADDILRRWREGEPA